MIKRSSRTFRTPPVQDYVAKHQPLSDDFRLEVYGTVGSECRAMVENFR